MKDTINQIAHQNASSIKYDHLDYAFIIKGSNSSLQKQAMIALSELLESKRPPTPDYPQKPFRDVQHSPTNGSTGVLIDLEDGFESSPSSSFTTAALPAQGQMHILEFRVDDRVQDPFEMYYADKRQKVELPTMLAEALSCEAKISGDGRTVTLTGKDAANVNRLVVQLEQMQEYFLRTPFRLDKATLVYGSNRDEFRLQFVPVQEHIFYSRHLEYLPSSLPRINPKHMSVIEKAVYDASRATWVLGNGVRLAPRAPAMGGRLPVSNVIGSGTLMGRGSPQTAWGRGSPVSDFQGRGPSHGGLSRGEWHEQERPTFGFGPAKRQSAADREMTTSANSWKTTPSSTRSPAQSSSPVPWSSSSSPVNPISLSPSASSIQKVIRATPPEWGARTFETNDEDHFPSLSAPATGAKASMPSLPPVRKVDKLRSGASTPTAARGPISSTASQSGGNSASNSIVFGDQEFEFLANIPGSRPPENDGNGLYQAKLRDPAKEREDMRRTVRELPRQQASSPRSSQVGAGFPPPQATFINDMREYNMRRLSESIRNGLRELRGQRKEIRLLGRLGCVLYPTVTNVLNQLWEYTQLEGVVVQQRELRPIFSPIATTMNGNVNNLYGFLGQSKSESAHFEIECDTRTNPAGRFTKTLVTVPSTVATLERVVTPWETFGEVTWNAVDKHMDFEIVLQAREGVIYDTNSALGRTDVKPFSAFRKKLSIGTHNSHITCHDVKGYLEVRNINFRDTRMYEMNGYTIVIHRIEELQLSRTGGLDAVTGRTSGPGKKWFEFEVYDESTNGKLKSNLTLIPGTVADWTVDDIVGSDPNNSEALRNMVRMLMVLVDECHDKFDQG
ncbi:hypothetical protein EDD11_004886 [Mortierella claussenii]|nr:hypothetical protein EDD11_004886 [Mortierella claussenii]